MGTAPATLLRAVAAATDTNAWTPSAERAHLLLVYAPHLLLRLPHTTRQGGEDDADGDPTLGRALKARMHCLRTSDWEALITDLEHEYAALAQRPRRRHNPASLGIIDRPKAQAAASRARTEALRSVGDILDRSRHSIYQGPTLYSPTQP